MGRGRDAGGEREERVLGKSEDGEGKGRGSFGESTRKGRKKERKERRMML